MEILQSKLDVFSKGKKKQQHELNPSHTRNRKFEMTKKIMNFFSRWILTTQFEPISARKVFPCFDEARFKSTFSIIINRPAHFKPSLSNTAITSSYFTSSK